MPFIIEGERKSLRRALTVVSADNPAASLVGGYKQLHSALRKCRHCLACDEDMKTKVRNVINGSHLLLFLIHDCTCTCSLHLKTFLPGHG